MDRIDAAGRSRNMASIGAKNTQPELTVRRLLRQLGYTYRLHVASLPGKPDIVFPSRRKAVFIHGCFWHRHPDCRRAYTPKTRAEFWDKKFRATLTRDERAIAALASAGWQSLVLWECETRHLPTLSEKVTRFIEGQK